MSEVEIPDEAVLAAAKAKHPLWGAYKAESCVEILRAEYDGLMAAYPSLRRAVLESVVEDVAKLASEFVEGPAWRHGNLSDTKKDYYRTHIRRVLGLAGEETDRG